MTFLNTWRSLAAICATVVATWGISTFFHKNVGDMDFLILKEKVDYAYYAAITAEKVSILKQDDKLTKKNYCDIKEADIDQALNFCLTYPGLPAKPPEIINGQLELSCKKIRKYRTDPPNFSCEY